MNTALIKALHQNQQKEYAVLVQGNVAAIKSCVKKNGGIFKYAYGTICSVVLNEQAIRSLAAQPNIKRIEYYENKIRPLDDTSIIKNNVLKVHNGAAPLPQAYDGSGTIFGLIDTGIDYTHPDFKDSTGKTRILWLWDQTKATATNTPQPFNYGQQWNNQEIDSGLCTHKDMYAFGHGSRVAGVAVGNGNHNPIYKGIATQSSIMCVAVNFSSNGPVILDAMHYLLEKMIPLNKPFVINLSLGDYYGSHDGKDLQAVAMDSMMANIPGRCLVAAAGNEGNTAFHLQYHLTADTNFTCMRSTTSGAFGYGLFADTNNFNHAYYTIGVYDSTHFQYKGNIGFRTVLSCLNTVKNDSIIHNGKRIGRIQTSASINNGTYELDITINPDSIGYFWTLETTGAGFFDAWDFEYVPQNALPTGLAALPRMTYYKNTDIQQTICTSYQCSKNVLTVANYNERRGFTSLGGVYSPQAGPYDTLSLSSSAGPTRDGRIKPDIAATGDNIMAAANIYLCHWNAVNYPHAGIISQDTMYMIFNGTSSAAPAASGVALLYLQKYPTATSTQIIQAITSCAKQDYYTGSALPNNNWGYGKLNGFGALTCSMTSGMPLLHNEKVILYPNPAQQQIQFLFNEETNADITIYSLLGQEVLRSHCNGTTYVLPIQSLSNGLYLYKITKENTAFAEGKFIKN
ncbi:MAG: S8 family peptidase [Bacteroidetes bacterium]|nr:S8 family peptidase [Bacteroidota bacterium]